MSQITLKCLFYNLKQVTATKINTMRNSLRSQHSMKSLDKFIKYELSQCKTCSQVDNSISRNYKAPLKPLAIPTQQFSCVHVDLSGPYPESKNGNKYLVIAVDRLTGYVVVDALPSKDSEVVGWWIIRNIFVRFGFVNVKITDNGGEFVNSLNSELQKLLGFSHRLITPYHPQANGKAESMVKKVKNFLKHNVAEVRGDYKEDVDLKESELDATDNGMFDWGSEWDMVALALTIIAVNMQPRTYTTYSPLLELTGRTPIIDPNQLAIEHESGDDFYDDKFTSITKESVQERIGKLQVFRASLKVSLLRAQTAMREKWDKKIGLTEQLEAGDHVL